MAQVLWLTIPLIALTMVAYMAYWLMTKITQIIETTKKISPHGVVKRDWLPTGRVDFTTRLNGTMMRCRAAGIGTAYCLGHLRDVQRS